MALLLTAFLSPAQRPARASEVYYVSTDGDDANPGSAEKPWRRIEWAMTRPFLRGGDTIRIRGGIYRPVAEATPHRDSPTDDTLIRPVASGEPGRPITVTAEPGEQVVLSGRFEATTWQPLGVSPVYSHDYTTPLTYPFEHPFQVVEDGRLLYRVSSLDALDRPGRCYVDAGARRLYVWTTDSRPPSAHRLEYGASASAIEFRGVEHWRLAGLAVIGFRSTGIMIAGRAGNIELDRLDVSYIGAHRPGADLTNGYAVAVYDSSGGNHIHDSHFHHTLAEAVHVSQTGAGGDLYENNNVYGNGGAEWFHEGHNGRTLTGPGMILRGDRVTVRGNRFDENGYHGLIVESDLRGSEGPANPSQNIIEGNVFAWNAGNGVYGDGKNGLAASLGNIIRFNLFDRNNQARAGSSGDGELRVAGNLDDLLIYNNTFYGDTANGVFLASGRVAEGTAQGADAVPERLRLVNNIVVHAGGARQTYALRGRDVPVDVATDYNNWYRNAAGPLVQWNSVEFGSFEEFRSRTGYERHGHSLDPRFVSVENGHFWLRAVSPLIGRGLGDVRGDGTLWAGPQTRIAPDLGAFPYRPLLVVSPGVLRFVKLTGEAGPPAQMLTVRGSAPMAIRWTVGVGQQWLRAAAGAGDVAGRVIISVQAEGLVGGVYNGAVRIFPAIEGEPAVEVAVVLEVISAPARRRK